VIDDVIERSESIREREDIVREAVQGGGDIRDLLKKYRVF
jgi:hypothetical protein